MQPMPYTVIGYEKMHIIYDSSQNLAIQQFLRDIKKSNLLNKRLDKTVSSKRHLKKIYHASPRLDTDHLTGIYTV